jgi:molybdenum cofactor biosynthesis enzyme MoaA
MDTTKCILKEQGFSAGSCAVDADGRRMPACRATLKYEQNQIQRLITSIHLSRPENYLSIYQSGYGLTPQNLDCLQTAGVDAFWLDIKAFDSKRHKWLTGCDNARILKLPAEIIKRGFVLEVLSLFIPEVVETDDLEDIARLMAAVDPHIPFTILAFFPEYRMKAHRSPTVEQMVAAYQKSKAAGLKNIRLGNLGVFLKTEDDQRYLMENVDPGAY